jgi:hypothetical protein
LAEWVKAVTGKHVYETLVGFKRAFVFNRDGKCEVDAYVTDLVAKLLKLAAEYARIVMSD